MLFKLYFSRIKQRSPECKNSFALVRFVLFIILITADLPPIMRICLALFSNPCLTCARLESGPIAIIVRSSTSSNALWGVTMDAGVLLRCVRGVAMDAGVLLGCVRSVAMDAGVLLGCVRGVTMDVYCQVLDFF